MRIGSIILTCLCVLGCNGVLHRSRPSDVEYLARYLPEISQNQIVRMDYTYQASVGGYVSLARIEVADVSKLAPLWNLPEDMVLLFNVETRDLERQFIKDQFTVANESGDKSVPIWVTLADNEPLYIHKDSVGKQRYRKFFLIKACPVVYMLVSGD